MVCVCTFVSSCLATKANNTLLEGCGLLESRPANWGALDQLIDVSHMHPVLLARTSTQCVQYSISKIDVYRNCVLGNTYCKCLDACIV